MTIEELKQAIKDANKALTAGEGITLTYWMHEYHEEMEKSLNIIKEILNEP